MSLRVASATEYVVAFLPNHLAWSISTADLPDFPYELDRVATKLPRRRSRSIIQSNRIDVQRSLDSAPDVDGDA